jgi:hypothetical protein
VVGGLKLSIIYHGAMKGKNRGGARPGAGRPATGKGTQVNTRIQPDELAAIDQWAAKHGCTRSEAVRRLAKLGLLADKKDDLE